MYNVRSTGVCQEGRLVYVVKCTTRVSVEALHAEGMSH
jgi:hypothetical protein